MCTILLGVFRIELFLKQLLDASVSSVIFLLFYQDFTHRAIIICGSDISNNGTSHLVVWNSNCLVTTDEIWVKVVAWNSDHNSCCVWQRRSASITDKDTCLHISVSLYIPITPTNLASYIYICHLWKLSWISNGIYMNVLSRIRAYTPDNGCTFHIVPGVYHVLSGCMLLLISLMCYWNLSCSLLLLFTYFPFHPILPQHRLWDRDSWNV